MSAALYSCGNRLLDALPAIDLSNLEADLTIVNLKAHQSTHSVGGAIKHVDFPIDAVLSVVATLKSGDTVEVGTVGSESFVESDAALNSALSSRTAFCQVQGRVGRMSIDRFEERMATSVAFARFMRQNLRATLFSAQQFTVCNLKHPALQRCARFLAMTADRVGRPQFALSHEFLAIMLGLKPAGVSEAADALEQMGAISYQRSVVTIVDRGILERAACECYRACRDSFTASLVLGA
jgi:CRP-like cAMP-binding protein